MHFKGLRFIFCVILGGMLWLTSPLFLNENYREFANWLPLQVMAQAQVDVSQSPYVGQDNQEENSATNQNEENQVFQPSPVMLNGDVLFEIKAAIGDVPPATRARDTTNKILKIAQDNSLSLDNIEVFKVESLRVISVEGFLINVVTPEDAKLANQSTDELVAQRLQAIKSGIQEYRAMRFPEAIVNGLIRAVIATAFFVLFLYLLNRLLPSFFHRFENWQAQRIERLTEQGKGIISRQKIAQILKILYRIIRVGSNLLLLYIYIPLILSCFPPTQPVSRQIVNYFWGAVLLVWDALVDYLPNLFIITLILVIAFYSIRFSHFIFNEIRRRRIEIKGFYPEWANPTHNIVVFLIVGLALVFVYPYLPAANSTGFQGVSVFIGALVTFGSTAIIGNIVSGIVLIYTRSFQVGDVIRVNNNLGRVLDKTMLSTRIITPDNEIITLPNASLFGTEITNFTASIRDEKKPLLLKTTITLGYDVPWRKVHETLVKAASESEGILKDPEPFVVQTSLDDFYVAYTLKAYTNQPYKMQVVYSNLHQNIQDKCNEVDIEILSPHYRAVRDGNMTTIPSDYLPDDYQAPGFRLNGTEKL
ncbi:MAG: mechanosensitive ion channel family protein [Synechocystis sp.]